MYISSQDGTYLINYTSGIITGNKRTVLFQDRIDGPALVLGTYNSRDETQKVLSVLSEALDLDTVVFQMPDAR